MKTVPKFTTKISQQNLVNFNDEWKILSTYFNRSPNMNSEKILGRKFKAFSLDFAVVLTINFFLFLSYSLTINMLIPKNDNLNTLYNNLTNLPMAYSVMTFVIVYFSYFVFFPLMYKGSTLGKMKHNLVTISDLYLNNKMTIDESLTLNQIMKRSLAYVTCYFSFGILFFISYFSEDKRGLADYLSESRTVCRNWLEYHQQEKLNAQETLFINLENLKVATSQYQSLCPVLVGQDDDLPMAA